MESNEKKLRQIKLVVIASAVALVALALLSVVVWSVVATWPDRSSLQAAHHVLVDLWGISLVVPTLGNLMQVTVLPVVLVLFAIAYGKGINSRLRKLYAPLHVVVLFAPIVFLAVLAIWLPLGLPFYENGIPGLIAASMFTLVAALVGFPTCVVIDEVDKARRKRECRLRANKRLKEEVAESAA